MCSWPALPKSLGANGVLEVPLSSISLIRKRSKGLERSSKNVFKEPVNILSKPKASTQSAYPVWIAFAARYKAVEPVEQLLLTLMIGIPVMPTV
jgi:hypothetical protein